MRFSGITLFLLIGCLCYVAADNTEHKRKRCGIHERYNDCGTVWWCELTCDQRLPPPCIDVCVAGCFCEEGYIRKHTNGTCICKDDCPRKC